MFPLRLTPHFIFPTGARRGVAVGVTVMDAMDAPPDGADA